MSVELYLVKPNPAGEVVFPFWDADGNDAPGVEYICIDSLKWATYRDPDTRFLECGLGMRDWPIPAAELVTGAELGLLQLMQSLMALHPDFGRWTPAELADRTTYEYAWTAFEDGAAWLGGTDEIRKVASAHAIGTWGGFKYLFERIREGGQKGYWGCWSY